MGLASLTAAPRVVAIGGRHYLLSAPSLRGYGLLEQYLRDSLGPGEHPLNADGSIDALFAGGLAHMLYVAMKRDQPWLSFHQANRLAFVVAEDPATLAILAKVVFGLSDKPKANPAEGETEEESADPHLNDVLCLGWGRIFEAERLSGRFTYAEIGDMTLEQFNNIATGGGSDEDRRLSVADVQAMYDAAIAADEGEDDE